MQMCFLYTALFCCLLELLSTGEKSNLMALLPPIPFLVSSWLFIHDRFHCSSTIPMYTLGKLHPSSPPPLPKDFINLLLEMLPAVDTSNFGCFGVVCNLAKYQSKGKSKQTLTQVWHHLFYNLQCKPVFPLSGSRNGANSGIKKVCKQTTALDF